MNRKCIKCNEIKNIKQFHKRKDRENSWETMCILCRRRINNKHNKDAYKKNPEIFKKRQNEYRIRFPEKYRLQRIKSNRKIREQVLFQYGGKNPKCECCKEKEIKFLEVDHINGGGTLQRKKVGAGSAFCYFLKRMKYPKGFQILCSNCNQAKGRYGVCPHKLKIYGKN